MKKLEATHKFQSRLLGISWKDKVKNDDIRKKNRLSLRKLEDIIKDKILRWFIAWGMSYEWKTPEYLTMT